MHLSNKNGWTRAAVVSQILMLVYFTITNHIDLYPWNNLTTPQLASTLTGAIPFGLVIFAYIKHIRWAMLVGMVHSYVWLALQLRQWWLPYLFGSTPLHRSFDWFFDNGYTETVRVLPFVEGRPIPDGQHLVLQALSLLVVITLTVAFFKSRKSRPVADGSTLPIG